MKHPKALMNASIVTSSSISMCTALEQSDVKSKPYCFWFESNLYHRLHEICWKICHPLLFCGSYVTGDCFTSSDDPVSIGSDFIEGLTSSLVQGLVVAVAEDEASPSLGRIIGCLTSKGEDAFINRPPTLSMPSLSSGSIW